MSAKAEALRLHAGGMPKQRVADTLGLPRSTVCAWLDPDHLKKQRARRERYRGTCIGCGAPTDGSGGFKPASQRCVRCAPIAARKWDAEACVAAIRLYAERYGRQPTSVDFNAAQARANGHPEWAERFYADGDYPTVATVMTYCGTWNAAIVAAGFQPIKGGTPTWRS